MYAYTDFDKHFVRQRAAQFRDQLKRNLAGQLSDDEFRPLRLQNGWYIQRHAPMARIAVPYGELSSPQLRMLARIAREFDRGYAHFTTRQNCQYNWIPLPKAADVMELLASVSMHGIQTSGNCIRNITSDCFAGVAADEIVDPRPYCEILRQWSTLHPEFAFLPRKFKIAVSGAHEDRAASAHIITQAEFDRVAAHFQRPAGVKPQPVSKLHVPSDAPVAFRRWLERNVHSHQIAGYRAVTLSLKRAGQAPGDVTDHQMELAADLADRYSCGELRVSHDQNLVLPWVREADLLAVWEAAREAAFATPNIRLPTDMI